MASSASLLLNQLVRGLPHMRLIKSDRGSVFYLCQRSATDSNFPKYPPLPVLQCAGYEPLEIREDLSS
jgi:hypothetical protein